MQVSSSKSGRPFGGAGWFSFVVVSSFLAAAVVLSLKFGMIPFVTVSDFGLERYQDITFKIWSASPPSAHGFLVFLTPEDFSEGRAYSNQSYAYVSLLWAMQKLANLNEYLSLRYLSALLNAGALGLTFYFVLIRLPIQGWRQAVAVWLFGLWVFTSPLIWIPATKFNLDNPYPLALSLSICAAMKFVQLESPIRSWTILSAALGFVYPVSGVLLSLAMLFLLVYSNSFKAGITARLVAALSVLIFSLVNYALPLTVSVLLGFESTNSSFLFRSGLDGDVSYFRNFFQAVFDPAYPRPVSLFVPLGIALALVSLASFYRTDGRRLKRRLLSIGLFHHLVFLMLCQYGGFLLFFPQAVSIHPYLFDIFLAFPVYILILVVGCYLRWRLGIIWIGGLLFGILNNLHGLAQSSLAGWGYY